jgi:nucleoside-diphosphate-sugar epimerase
MPIVALRPHLIWGPGDTQLVGRIVAKTKAGRMAMIGSGNALIDSTFITNAVDAIVAAVDAAPGLGGQAFVVSNGQPRTVSELIGRIAVAAGLTPSDRHVPARLAFAGGWLAERTWERQQRTDDPPMTSFLAEQLSTAHWFDQRATRDALNWTPEVGIDEGFERLRAWFQQQ